MPDTDNQTQTTQSSPQTGTPQKPVFPENRLTREGDQPRPVSPNNPKFPENVATKDMTDFIRRNTGSNSGPSE
jgi:hypothetical protein